MSDIDKQQSKAVPFFARYLEGQRELLEEEMEATVGGRGAMTEKYPSDAEDGGGAVTLKYPSDAEDGGSAVTLKYPSDAEDVAADFVGDYFVHGGGGGGAKADR